MILIESIDIMYFRSIYSLKLTDLNNLNIFSGKNDCGKSNILKALNLFFNNETDWKTPLNFSRDFSYKRLDQARKTIKSKQFIRISLTFIRGNHFENSLPDKFTITKTWYRDTTFPTVNTSIEKQFEKGQTKAKSIHRARASVQRFLNKIRYEYVPAIKDRSFFSYSLGLLQDSIINKPYGSTNTERLINDLNNNVGQETNLIKNEFYNVCGVETDIQLPNDKAELFRAFKVATKIGASQIPLEMRGDGIQVRFLPSLLHHIAKQSKYMYIWGFEEPENCLEHLMASKLAGTFNNEYCIKVQTFLTTHSPAFINLEGHNVTSWRIFFTDMTEQAQLYPPTSLLTGTNEALKEDLGFVELYKKHQNEIEAREREVDSLSKTIKDIESSTQPVLLTEGKTDVLILQKAWKSLYGSKKPTFRMIPCDTCPSSKSGAGGINTLKMYLESNRPDLPMTVGLIDRDDDGIKIFNDLSRNFRKVKDCKFHKNNHTAAVLIPSQIPDRKEFADNNNLPIEYIFPERYVTSQIKGKGLIFEQQKLVSRVGNKTVNIENTTDLKYRKIKDNKRFFAEHIVPTFPKTAFNDFKLLFNIINKVFKDLKKKRGIK